MYRVVLHAMSLYRDAPMMNVLARLLENLGCEVFITSVRNYVPIIKYWRPHAVLYGTLSKSSAILGAFEGAKLFYCAGEGGESKEFMDENFYLDNPDIYDRTDRIFVWGNGTIANLVEKCLERGLTGLADKVRKDGKVSAIGHPRMDLVRFLPQKTDRKKTIGINTSFNRINCFDGRSALSFLLSDDESYAWIHRELREAKILMDAIDRIIDETDLNISIRPYPNENKRMYRKVKGETHRIARDRYNGRVQIDESLDYGSWLRDQSVVVSRVSTTITEAYQCHIPVIFIDRLAGNEAFYKDRSEVERLLVETAFQPSNMDELHRAMLQPESVPMKPENLKNLWNMGYGFDKPGSALQRVASGMVDELSRGCHGKRPVMPKLMLKVYDELLFRWVCRKDPFHVNFNFKQGFHAIPGHYDEIVENIRAEGVKKGFQEET